MTNPASGDDAARVERVTQAIRFAINPLDGDPIGVMIHTSEYLYADTVPEQIALIDEVCRAMARAAIAAMPAPAVDPDLVAENARANKEVLALITSIWKAEFRGDAPNWQPLPDLVGRISQLDNMYAGVRGQRDVLRTEIATLRSLIRDWSAYERSMTDPHLQETHLFLKRARAVLARAKVTK